MFVHGEMTADFPVERHGELLDDLANADDEHPDVALSDAEGWTLSFFRSGLVIFKNGEDEVGGELYLRDVSREQQLELMAWLDAGEFDLIQALDWADDWRP